MSAAAEELAPGLAEALELVPEEGSYRITEIEGELPAGLRGTYYLNGPARFRRGGERYRHWLDGDGMVSALTFDDEGARITSRFVRSAKWKDEEEAGRPLYRTFGTRFAEDRLLHGIALASPVNVSVFPFAGKLLAFGEQGLPWELDPDTLETREEHTFGRRLNAVSPLSAHPNIDAESGEMLNFGVSFASRQPSLTLYRFDAQGELVLRRRHSLEHACSLHDFGLSPRFALFYLAPYLLDVEALMAGSTIIEALSWRPEAGTQLLVLNREDGAEVARVPIGRGYCLHQINAFEEGDRLFVDAIEMEEPVYGDYHPLPDLFAEVKPAQPARLEVDLEAGRLVSRSRIDYRRSGDFPAIHPDRAGRRTDRFWMLGISRTGEPGRKFFDQLLEGDFVSGTAPRIYECPAGCYLAGEPTFAPRRDAGSAEEGWILCPRLDTRDDLATDFLIFDAADVSRGPQARLRLRHPLQPGFHAVFAET